jgi:hypothetical protein
VGRVRAVPKDGALLPLVNRLLGDTKALGQDTGCLIAGRNLINMASLAGWIARTLSTLAERLWP